MGDLNAAYAGSAMEEDFGDSLHGGILRHSVSNPPPQLGDFTGSSGIKNTTNRGKNGTKRKKLASQKIQQLPPMDLSAEKKIEELHMAAVAAASSSSQRMLPLSNISPRLQSENSVVSALTGTEAEFLARQSIASETSQLSQTSAAFQSNVETSQVNNNAASGIIVDALKGKIQALERQVVSLNAIIQKKESELEKKDNKLKNIQVDFEKYRKDSGAELKRLQSEVCCRCYFFFNLKSVVSFC